MTDREFVERMIPLNEKMFELYNADPIDQNTLLELLDEIYKTSARFNRSRRRSHWGAILFCLSLIFFLACFVWAILF